MCKSVQICGEIINGCVVNFTPYVLKTFKKVNLRGINLSKHSTGLTYKHYFNWEAALKDTFAKNPDIALVVVLLGANDPWGMKNISFKSVRWEETYIQRIEERSEERRVGKECGS